MSKETRNESDIRLSIFSEVGSQRDLYLIQQHARHLYFDHDMSEQAVANRMGIHVANVRWLLRN